MSSKPATSCTCWLCRKSYQGSGPVHICPECMAKYGPKIKEAAKEAGIVALQLGLDALFPKIIANPKVMNHAKLQKFIKALDKMRKAGVFGNFRKS